MNKNKIIIKITKAIKESSELIGEAKRKEDKIRLEGQIDGLLMVIQFIREASHIMIFNN